MDNRALLLDSALGLFAQRGYDAVGVQEIAQTAGLTKPTLYHYFGNKRGLLEALLTERHKPLLAAVRDAARYEGDLTLSLRRLMDTYLGFAGRDPDFYRFWLSLLFAPAAHEAAPIARLLYADQQALVEGMFVAAARDHGNMRGRHEQYALTYIGFLNSLIGRMLAGAPETDEARRHELLRQFSHGIYS